jgi:hypothetical protein
MSSSMKPNGSIYGIASGGPLLIKQEKLKWTLRKALNRGAINCSDGGAS